MNTRVYVNGQNKGKKMELFSEQFRKRTLFGRLCSYCKYGGNRCFGNCIWPINNCQKTAVKPLLRMPKKAKS